MSAVDILILGDGPLAYALALAVRKVASSVEVRVARAPAEGCLVAGDSAEVVDHHSQAILESLGVWPSIAKKTQPISFLHISEQGRLGVTRFTARDLRASAANSKDVLAHAISRVELQQLLAQRCERELSNEFSVAELGGVKLLDSGEVQAVLAGETVTAKLVIATDRAATEYLNTELGLQPQAVKSDAVLLSAELQFEQAAADQVFVRFTSSGPMTLMQRPAAEQVLLNWAVPTAVAAELLALDESAFIERIQDDFGWRLGRLVAANNRKSDAGHGRSARLKGVNLMAVGAANYCDPSSQWPWPTALNRGLQDIGHFADALVAAVQSDACLSDSSHWQGFLSKQAEQLQSVVDSEAAVKRWFTSDLGPLNHLRGVALMGLGASGSLKRMLLADYGQQASASCLERGITEFSGTVAVS